MSMGIIDRIRALISGRTESAQTHDDRAEKREEADRAIDAMQRRGR